MKRNSVGSSVVWNLIGTGGPLIVALFSMPILIQSYGNQRFGLLTIVWALVGYLSIFDMGLGRALTKLVAEKLGKGECSDISVLATTAIVAIFSFGICAALLLSACASQLVVGILSVDSQYSTDSINAIYVLSVSLPFVVLSTALVGVLEAYSEFRLINIIKFVLGISNFLGPVVALHWSSDLTIATLVIAVARFLSAFAYFVVCLKLKAIWINRSAVRLECLRPLFKFGAWITVSNFISPLMVQVDKFFIGAAIGVGALQYYVVPSDMINRLSFVPAALVGVFFPLFSRVLAVHDEGKSRLAFSASCKIMFFLLAPPSLFFMAFAREGLSLWLGPGFSSNAIDITRVLVFGFLMNGMARLPHSFIQGAGRPDITAKIHFFELPFYIGCLFVLLKYFGVYGAALAWSVRVTIDSLAHFYLASVIVPEVRSVALKYALLAVLFSIIMLLVGIFVNSIYVRFVAVLALCWPSYFYIRNGLLEYKSSVRF